MDIIELLKKQNDLTIDEMISIMGESTDKNELLSELERLEEEGKIDSYISDEDKTTYYIDEE